MRIIRIGCCRNCPLKERAFDDRGNPFYRCTHIVTEGRRIIHLDIVQDYCELAEERVGCDERTTCENCGVEIEDVDIEQIDGFCLGCWRDKKPLSGKEVECDDVPHEKKETDLFNGLHHRRGMTVFGKGR